MTKAQKGIIKQNIKLLELVYKLHSDRDNSIFDDDLTDALLLGICAQQALLNSIERQENQINLKPSNN